MFKRKWIKVKFSNEVIALKNHLIMQGNHKKIDLVFQKVDIDFSFFLC